MENDSSKIHQSQRMILILEAHSIVFLQQPDYDFTCKSSLFLKAQMKTEAEEVNKRQALCFTRDTFSWSKPALALAQFTKEGFCFQRRIWPFCFALHFIPEEVLIWAKQLQNVGSVSTTKVSHMHNKGSENTLRDNFLKR